MEDEQQIQNTLDRLGSISTPLTSASTSWDGFSAVHATYEQDGTGGVKAHANAILQRLVRTATSGLDTRADVQTTGGFTLEASFVRRSDQTLVVVVAVLPSQLSSVEASMLSLSDVAGGAALGQFGDQIGLQCDRLLTEAFVTLDILWSIDNSVSMSDNQAALAQSAMAMDARLNGATVDWRAAVVTSAFYAPPNACTNRTCGQRTTQQCRPFTRDLATFSNWMTRGQSSWIGAGGTCNVVRENIVRGSQMLLSDPGVGNAVTFMPPSATEDPVRVRQSAALLVIFMGDADDQFYRNQNLPAGITTYENFFRGLGIPVRMGGILCPPGSRCGEAHRTPRVAQSLINRFNGVVGSLLDVASIAPSVISIIDSTVGSVSPYVLSKDAIPSTIKVVLQAGSTTGACNTNDVPRSRVNGFDYDPPGRTIAFYGDCRPDPNQAGARMTVSYRYWIDRTNEPDGGPCTICDTCVGLQRCDRQACVCTCDQSITCNPGYRWDTESCGCVCDAQSLQCSATRVADEGLCACVCRADCGGCGAMQRCNTSRCECVDVDL